MEVLQQYCVFLSSLWQALVLSEYRELPKLEEKIPILHRYIFFIFVVTVRGCHSQFAKSFLENYFPEVYHSFHSVKTGQCSGHLNLSLSVSSFQKVLLSHNSMMSIPRIHIHICVSYFYNAIMSKPCIYLNIPLIISTNMNMS